MRRLLQMLPGPLIWFGHFSLVYGVAGLANSFGLGSAVILSLSWAATAIAIGGLCFLLWRSRHQPLSQALVALSVVAVLFTAMALWLVPYA